jgi:hypothetical protein
MSEPEDLLIQLIIEHLSGAADPHGKMEDVAKSLGISRATLYRNHGPYVRAIKAASTVWSGYAEALGAKESKRSAEAKLAEAQRLIDALTAQIVVLTLRDAFPINQAQPSDAHDQSQRPISLDVERALRRSDDTR